MFFRDTISLFDTVETEEGLKIIQYILSNVQLDCSGLTSLDKDMEKKNNTVTLYIPDTFVASEIYVSPITWGSLDLESKLTHFTLKPGQVICKLSDYVEIKSVDDLYSKYDDVFRVVGVVLYGSVLPHFEVVCR